MDGKGVLEACATRHRGGEGTRKRDGWTTSRCTLRLIGVVHEARAYCPSGNQREAKRLFDKASPARAKHRLVSAGKPPGAAQTRTKAFHIGIAQSLRNAGLGSGDYGRRRKWPRQSLRRYSPALAGSARWYKGRVFVSEAFRFGILGFEQVDEDFYKVYFGDVEIGEFDAERALLPAGSVHAMNVRSQFLQAGFFTHFQKTLIHMDSSVCALPCSHQMRFQILILDVSLRQEPQPGPMIPIQIDSLPSERERV